MKFILLIALLCPSCTPATTQTLQGRAINPNTQEVDPLSLQSLHVRLTLRPTDGGVSYFGWYDGKRNLLGAGGISAALIGMEPPELQGETKKLNPTEIQFEGVDQNQIAWIKRYRLSENTVHVTLKITNKRDLPFDAIIYSLSDLPDSTITGTPREQNINAPIASARFQADIDATNFPGESMSPYILRSDTRRLESGDSMEFHMTWQLGLPKRN